MIGLTTVQELTLSTLNMENYLWSMLCYSVKPRHEQQGCMEDISIGIATAISGEKTNVPGFNCDKSC
jgi:hypothetical protein